MTVTDLGHRWVVGDLSGAAMMVRGCVAQAPIFGSGERRSEGLAAIRCNIFLAVRLVCGGGRIYIHIPVFREHLVVLHIYFTIFS